MQYNNSMIPSILLVFLLIFSPSYAEPSIVSGYQNKYYMVDSNASNKVCEYNHRWVEQWCMDIQKKPLGIYVGFKQVLTYSKHSIKSINPIRKGVKWEIPLRKVSKLHLNYPAIVTLKGDGTLTGYDFFTGLKLWRKEKTSYRNLFETSSNIWLTKAGALLKMDPLSSEVLQTVPWKEPVRDMHGNEIYVFIHTKSGLYHMNTVNLKKTRIGKTYSVVSKVSDFVLIRGGKQQQLRRYNNSIVSKNMQVDVQILHSPTKTYYFYIEKDQLFLITKNKTVSYQLTHKKERHPVKYAYKLKNNVRVFYNKGQDLWTLKQNIKKPSDPDT